MSTDPQSLLSIAKCFSCYDPASPGESMELALLVQLVQQLNPTANTSPQALLAAGNCYLCYGTIGQTQIMKLGLLALLVNSSTGGKQLFSDFTSASTSGVATTPLYTNIIPANTLTVNGQKIIFDYYAQASFGGLGWTLAYSFTVGGQSVASDGFTVNSPGGIKFEIVVTRTGPTTARVSSMVNASGTMGTLNREAAVTTVDLSGIDWTQPQSAVLTASSSDPAQTLTAEQAYAQLLT